jgi:GH25 family lysozyme M1 (1,4-beta-N-acetylmuramidase)
LTYGKTGPQMTEWISKWCSSVEQATGKTPWLYTNRRIMNRVDPTNLTKYPLWLANYNSSDKENPPDSKPWPNMIAWQYTDKAKSPGVKDPCDGNFLYGQVSA